MIQESEINELETISFKYFSKSGEECEAKHYTVEQGGALDIIKRRGEGKLAAFFHSFFYEI